MSLVVLGLAILLFLLWAWGTQPLFVEIERKRVPPVSPARLETHVRMLSETFFPRDAAHPENLDRTAAYVRQKFAQANGRVSEQPFKVAGRTYRNVIAWFGSDTQERIVVGAHYDTAGPQPGADDNASGVAGLIKLAYLLCEVPLSLGVELVAFTLEEQPHFRTAQMGSAVHVASLTQQNIPVRVISRNDWLLHGCSTESKFSLPVPGRFLSLAGKLYCSRWEPQRGIGGSLSQESDAKRFTIAGLFD